MEATKGEEENTCGEIHFSDMSAVNSGHVNRCTKCSIKARGDNRRTHGKSNHRLYKKWQDMKKRCYNDKVERYKNYGARGITVCDEWLKDFSSFFDWCIKNGWKEDLQIDRIDVNGNYCPENCRIITRTENGFNKTNTFYVTIGEKKIGLSELLYTNNLSRKYSCIHLGIRTGKRDIHYYIKKLSIKIPD